MSSGEEDSVATLADSSATAEEVTMTTSSPAPRQMQASSSPILIPVQRFRNSRGSDSGVSVGSFSPRHCHVCNSPRAYSPTVFVFPSPSAHCRAYSPSRDQGTQTPSPLTQTPSPLTQTPSPLCTHRASPLCQTPSPLCQVVSTPMQVSGGQEVVSQATQGSEVQAEGAAGGVEVRRRPRHIRRVQSSAVFRPRYYSDSDGASSPMSQRSAGERPGCDPRCDPGCEPLPDLLQFRARSRSEPVRVSPEELVARELRRISDEFDSLMFTPPQRRSTVGERPVGERPASYGGADLRQREQQDWWSFVLAVFRSKSADNVVPPRQKRGEDRDDRDNGNDAA